MQPNVFEKINKNKAHVERYVHKALQKWLDNHGFTFFVYVPIYHARRWQLILLLSNSQTFPESAIV